MPDQDQQQTPVVDPTRLFYVTVKNGRKTGFLLGPYETHQEALDRVEHGRTLAVQADPWADFYFFGTASLPREGHQPKTVFGV